MERITVKSENGYELSEGVSLEKVIEKLAAFENMYEELLTDIDKTVLSADRLKNMQKTKTATYRQLFAEKLKLNELIFGFDSIRRYILDYTKYNRQEGA